MDSYGSTGAPSLEARGLTLAYDHRVVVDDLHLVLPGGRVTVVVGANACGKSTLLRALARLLAPSSGAVLLDGRDITTVPTRRVAQVLGLLPQSPTASDGMTVRDLVARGRSPHQRWWQQWSRQDEEAVDEALALCDLTLLADRDLDALSGGQRQRAWIAMTLAQETRLLLLDEPTTYLDMAHQVDVLELVSSLNRRDGRTVVMVLHDLNQACRYADHLVAMKDGRIVAAGAPSEVVTEDLVREVFGLPVHVMTDPVAGTPLVVPLPSRAAAGVVAP
ncbi:iron complex transport system ATP-binding protein [Motilibacter peucedani]|uniref:Iron complex transport system ATP-binding protein n=1 Tax=Motilibacter peucedani TaxID=598650 RepID=A0A420XUL6_9ACTN|nr:ABC transporter ATP-binding protein [Motilibacter peucedani]RKS80524.1 iron complex transport system ATP-binding protein [Motilibacter peucedani]